MEVGGTDQGWLLGDSGERIYQSISLRFNDDKMLHLIHSLKKKVIYFLIVNYKAKKQN